MVFINPFGYKLITETYRWYKEVFLQRSGDWRSPNFNSFGVLLGYFFVGTIFVLYILKDRKKKVQYEYVISVAFWQYMFLFAQRNSAIYILNMIMIIPLMCSFEGIKTEKTKNILNSLEKKAIEFRENGGYKISVIFLAFFIGGLLLFNKTLEKKYPTEVWGEVLKPLEYLERNNITGKGLHPDMYGNLIIWKLYPNMKVFVDNRPNFYSQEVLDDYGKIFQIKNEWKDKIKKYDPNWLLEVSRVSTLHVYETQKNKWVKVYSGERATIFLDKTYYEARKDEIKLELE
jgi:hypothetical protein